MPEAQKMASEKRLIDANAMREDWLENGENEYVYDTNAVLASIDAQPTVDAVEVVRCKNCQFSKYFEESGTRKCRTRNGMYRTVEDSDFCSYGERKDNETLQELP